MQETSSTADLELERADPFLKDLRAQVAAHFESSGQSPRDCPRMYLKTAIVFAWFFGSYVLLVFFTPNWWSASLAAVSLALAMAGIGFNVQHDGSHRAYSDRMWLNKLTAMSMDLVGASSFHWRASTTRSTTPTPTSPVRMTTSAWARWDGSRRM